MAHKFAVLPFAVNNFTDRTDSVSATYSVFKSKLIIWRFEKAFIAFNNAMFKNVWDYRTNGNTSKVVTCKTFVITIPQFRCWYYVTISKAIWRIRTWLNTLNNLANITDSTGWQNCKCSADSPSISKALPTLRSFITTNQLSVKLMIICNGQTVIVISGIHVRQF